MEIDGYRIEQDEEFDPGEQYWVYKDGKLKGWICFFCGILRVTFCEDKETLGSPFLFHDVFGENTVDEFSTSKERRAAFRKGIAVLEQYYGDAPNTLRIVTSLFPGAVVEQNQEQLTMF